ncbi:hypothetical protein [Pseudoalteromonas piscicida]|uniref:hypothetical protein n=1 Tax=Pseudoalteromonas piscicida TaxID=43662 RepID=UPI001E46EC84|nr:hypothetical protein [Pseudoalteromonas piscicida]
MSKISENIYQKLTNSDEARACKAIDEKACKEVPGNYVLILLSQLLSALGDALLNPKITLPWLMQSLGAPAYMISALVPIRESGSLIPNCLLANGCASTQRESTFGRSVHLFKPLVYCSWHY